MEEKILHNALENLKKATGIEATFTYKPQKGVDGEMDMLFQNGKELFLVEVKKEIRNYQLQHIAEVANHTKNFLVIAETIFPNIKEELRKNGIGYLDGAGNIYLQTAKHHLWVEGNKKQKIPTEKINRAFTAAGLKVVYLFLIDENFINNTQRTIAEKAGVALGNINYVLNGLKEQKFLIEKNKKEFVLNNKKELLEKWLVAFDEKLKPTLHVGNFRFLKNDEYNHWQKLPLKKQKTFWGGEAAGAVITKYLLPEIFTLYTDEARSNIIKDYHLIPEPNGNIRVYKKFWLNAETYNDTTVHPLLAYTDLVNTGDRRCMETATKIYDELLRNGFQ